MARIFLGICQVGAWGCFDEFNRLEERILSAVSQQIQSIQLGLQSLSDTGKAVIDLTGRSFELHKDTGIAFRMSLLIAGIFITMNPGYAGRSNLPDNLKKLFRSFAMTKPDKELITQVMLYSQGFQSAKELASKIVPFFELCLQKLSDQTHYDFGLRALKSVLVTSGNLKRSRYQASDEDNVKDEMGLEAKLILQALHETVAPKLVGDDVRKLTLYSYQPRLY
jgi:dynein cytoplasmic 1 heavy chain